MRAATVTPGNAEFVELTERYRTELLAHCYRMTGSVDEAEDLVQEAYLRAWRSYHAFERRSSVRTYLYRIATNVCLTALDRRSRRILPAGQDVQTDEWDWLEPIPDAALTGASDPAAIVGARAGVRLAFVAALQHLPPFRRAVLILRDVLAMPAGLVGEVLDTTTAAVNSALPRARAQIAAVAPTIDEVSEPPEPHRRAVLDNYAAAFEKADITTLVRLLREDIVLEMPPLAEWFRGRTTVSHFFATRVLTQPGSFHMVPTSANSQPAFVAYQPDSDQLTLPHAVHVLTLDTRAIARIAVFFNPSVCARFMDRD